jgi:dipeptidyl aminopeptidase/acylaminoacyl peptidase
MNTGFLTRELCIRSSDTLPCLEDSIYDPSMRFLASFAFASAAFLSLPIASAAQDTPPKAIPAVAAANRRERETRVPRSVALSPDGTLLAYSLRGREGSELHLVPMPAAGATIDDSKDKLVTVADNTNCSNGDPVWSPDSRTLAFTSTCPSKEQKPGQHQLQIFLFSPADGKTRQLTHLTGNIQQAAFSPDGKRIAFLFVENATRTAGALDAMKPFAGVIGEDNIEIQGVYGVDIDSGKGRWLVPATPESYVYEFAWSPNSKELAFIGAHTPGENNWWVAKLYTQSAESSTSSARAIFDPATTRTALHQLQIAVPRWSPDGKRIAFIGGIMSDQGSTGGDVWVVNADGKDAPVDITPLIDGTPTWEVWLDNHTVGFVQDRRGHILLTDADADKRVVVPGSSDDLGQVAVSGGPIKNAISASNTGLVAFTESGFSQAPEIWGGSVGAPGGLHALTHLNAGIPTATNKIESVEWENEGFHVQGWLAYPANYDPAKKYPLIVTVHGGPTSSAGARGGFQWASQGYFEFAPNPRGSMGQGEAFAQANVKDFGYGDLRDILTGMDFIEAKVPAIDKNREGITGWSYGGFMTMFAVTQTHRFKAAVAGAGIANWQSYYGENSIGEWMIPFFGASVYDDPAVYAKSSPITFIKNVTTPTLVIVGDRDGECPAPQSFEFWHALKAEGVKTQLVVYPNEGHGFRDPEHLKDRAERMAKWFAENLK